MGTDPNTVNLPEYEARIAEAQAKADQSALEAIHAEYADARQKEANRLDSDNEPESQPTQADPTVPSAETPQETPQEDTPTVNPAETQGSHDE